MREIDEKRKELKKGLAKEEALDKAEIEEIVKEIDAITDILAEEIVLEEEAEEVLDSITDSLAEEIVAEDLEEVRNIVGGEFLDEVTDELAVEMVAAEIETAQEIENENIENADQFSDEIIVGEIVRESIDEDLAKKLNDLVDSEKVDISPSIDMNFLEVGSSTDLPGEEEVEGSGSIDSSLDFGDIQEV